MIITLKDWEGGVAYSITILRQISDQTLFLCFFVHPYDRPSLSLRWKMMDATQSATLQALVIMQMMAIFCV